MSFDSIVNTFVLIHTKSYISGRFYYERIYIFRSVWYKSKGFSMDFIKVIFRAKFIFKSFTGSKPKLWPRNCYELVFQFWPSNVTSQLWPRICELAIVTSHLWPRIVTSYLDLVFHRDLVKLVLLRELNLRPRGLMTT